MFTQDVSKYWSRAVMFALSIGVVCMMFSSTASAQVWDKKTTVTFSAPVEIPGIGAQVLACRHVCFQVAGFTIGPEYCSDLQ